MTMYMQNVGFLRIPSLSHVIRKEKNCEEVKRKVNLAGWCSCSFRKEKEAQQTGAEPVAYVMVGKFLSVMFKPLNILMKGKDAQDSCMVIQGD